MVYESKRCDSGEGKGRKCRVGIGTVREGVRIKWQWKLMRWSSKCSVRVRVRVGACVTVGERM